MKNNRGKILIKNTSKFKYLNIESLNIYIYIYEICGKLLNMRQLKYEK